jgi:hypothetical protein
LTTEWIASLPHTRHLRKKIFEKAIFTRDREKRGSLADEEKYFIADFGDRSGSHGRFGGILRWFVFSHTAQNIAALSHQNASLSPGS